MFPTLNYLFNYLFGTNNTFNFPPTFGFWVAISFLAAAWVLNVELKRKEKLGLVHGIPRKITIGKPASIVELLINGLFGFVIGYKLVGIFTEKAIFQQDPQGYLISGQGNLIGGLVLGAIAAYWRYYEKKKEQLAVPKEENVIVRPYQLVGSITLVAAVSGILGAKIFHQLEYWNEFTADPLGSLLSTSGLTFYGGLIGGFLGVWWYARRNKIALIHIADSLGPALILAYGIGRIGCQMSGDGDWGIINSAYRIDDAHNYTLVEPERIHADLEVYGPFLKDRNYSYYPKPKALSFLPTWMFAFHFPHNVNSEGMPIAGCEGQYCNRLPLPVFPTAFYETLMGLAIFGFLWAVRKRLKLPGQVFFLYLALNGLERLLIEQMRVNSTYDLAGFAITQAEIISFSLIVVGVTLFLLAGRMKQQILKI